MARDRRLDNPNIQYGYTPVVDFPWDNHYVFGDHARRAITDDGREVNILTWGLHPETFSHYYEGLTFVDQPADLYGGFPGRRGSRGDRTRGGHRVRGGGRARGGGQAHGNRAPWSGHARGDHRTGINNHGNSDGAFKGDDRAVFRHNADDISNPNEEENEDEDDDYDDEEIYGHHGYGNRSSHRGSNAYSRPYIGDYDTAASTAAGTETKAIAVAALAPTEAMAPIAYTTELTKPALAIQDRALMA
ncbi:MAG: hypothetical protein M1819_006486 [Sarea resinae]|nr:MAG: hypothetical protein M1819_006486 [Sarea resinae]